MSENSLISLHWFEAILDKILTEECALIEAALKDYLAEGYKIEDLTIHKFWDGRWKVHVITPEERWVNWYSDNHGWGSKHES